MDEWMSRLTGAWMAEQGKAMMKALLTTNEIPTTVSVKFCHVRITYIYILRTELYCISRSFMEMAALFR